jgi:drug/metabolite transporter (DMT)-like permease
VTTRKISSLLTPSPYLLLSLSSLFWAGNWVVGRAMRNDIPPVAMGFWRWLLAFLILLPFAAGELRRNWHVIRRDWPKLMLMGAAGATIFNTMIYVALQYTQTTNGILFNSLTPILVVLMSWLVFRDRLSRRQEFGVMVSFLGVTAIVARGDPDVLLGMNFSLGDLWLFAAMILWSAYTLMLRWRPTELTAIGFLAAILGLGLPVSLPFYAWELLTRGGFGVTVSTVAALAYYATLPSIAAYLFWNRGVAQVGPSKASLFAHLMPVFGAALAVVFLGERLYAYHFIGAALIFSGIWLTSRARGEKSASG